MKFKTSYMEANFRFGVQLCDHNRSYIKMFARVLKDFVPNYTGTNREPKLFSQGNGSYNTGNLLKGLKAPWVFFKEISCFKTSAKIQKNDHGPKSDFEMSPSNKNEQSN